MMKTNPNYLSSNNTSSSAKTDKNVMIPMSLLTRIIYLLQCWNVSGYGLETRHEYDDVVHELDVKIQKIELRDAYSKIIHADGEEARDQARINYLQQREALLLELRRL